MVGIDGLQAGDPVTSEQMLALFGAGMHPLAAHRLQQLSDANLSDDQVRAATRLGAPFKVMRTTPNRFQVQVARRFAAVTGSGDLLAADRRDMRAEVAREFFQAEHGRLPADERELAATIVKLSRPPAQPVAGYDLTFSPVKSVSTLWAVADPHIAAMIERAHHAAVSDALIFIERHALFTREGPQGVRQVNVQGLVAAAFTHRDSRSGDPDLHTHVAVAKSSGADLAAPTQPATRHPRHASRSAVGETARRADPEPDQRLVPAEPDAEVAELGSRRFRRGQPRPIGSRQSTVTRRPPGSRSVVAHSGRTAPAAAKQFKSNNARGRTPERYET